MHIIWEMRCDRERSDKKDRLKQIAAVKSVAEDMGLSFTERTGMEDEAAIQVSLPCTDDDMVSKVIQFGFRLVKAGKIASTDFNSAVLVEDDGTERELPVG